MSGIIDCAAEVIEGDCYIAGQTSPGGVIVRNLIFDSYYNPTRRPYNVIVRHFNSRPHTTHFRAASGWIDEDGLRRCCKKCIGIAGYTNLECYLNQLFENRAISEYDY